MSSPLSSSSSLALFILGPENPAGFWVSGCYMNEGPSAPPARNRKTLPGSVRVLFYSPLHFIFNQLCDWAGPLFGAPDPQWSLISSFLNLLCKALEGLHWSDGREVLGLILNLLLPEELPPFLHNLRTSQLFWC